MKKEYIRPEAEKINFQAEEVMTGSSPQPGNFIGDGGSFSVDTEDWTAQNP